MQAAYTFVPAVTAVANLIATNVGIHAVPDLAITAACWQRQHSWYHDCHVCMYCKQAHSLIQKDHTHLFSTQHFAAGPLVMPILHAD